MNPEDIVTVARIAEILRLNQQTVRNWIDQGSLPAIRVGRRVRVRWSDVEAMMKPAGPAIPGGGSSRLSADGQAFWDGEYMPLAALPHYAEA
jgi:excisionase family DNA binding protein